MRRGQATLELALGSIIFVGVLLIGIHMAEFAQLSLKVQDAQTFAVWEASGRRVQTRELTGATSLSPFRRTLDSTTGVGPAATRRFADFNGLDGTSNGNVISRALTEGSGVEVKCEEDRSLSRLFPATSTAGNVLREEGGLRCTATALVKAINVPRRFLQKDTGGFFRESIVRQAPIPVCGMGLPVNGHCRGALAILTNDWGLANEETEECKLACAASPYRGLVKSMFGGGGSAGAQFAASFAGAPPVTADSYFFSYSGVESSMLDYVGGEGTPNFITGGAGAGMVPRMTHPKCFLGKNCP